MQHMPRELIDMAIHRLSTRFSPTIRHSGEQLPGLNALLRGGFVRQSSAGIYSLLPNGDRVRQKMEDIIDREMHRIGASKLSLPSLLSKDLWQITGRWSDKDGETFRLKDRKKSDFLLAPTHEEEITALIGRNVTSMKLMPVRVYQIGRKYRDEARPRAGLLRGREFLMKDLYTFDESKEQAIKTYYQVVEAYNRIFQTLGLPFKKVEADSGAIGGDFSHEYQFLTPSGEDLVVACSSPNCDYAANIEAAVVVPPCTGAPSLLDFRCDSKDTNQGPVYAIYRRDHELNPLSLQKALQNTAPPSNAEARVLVSKDLDGALPTSDVLQHFVQQGVLPAAAQDASVKFADLISYQEGDLCPKCNHHLSESRAIEVGHTFYLGDKYSKPLKAHVPQRKPEQPFEMGCYGIGVTRLVGAVAEICVDSKGIAWPASIAPFKVAIVPFKQDSLPQDVLFTIAQAVGPDDVLVDDRFGDSFGARMTDAELVGYAFVVVFGKRYQKEGVIEVRSRKDGQQDFSSVSEALQYIQQNSPY